MAHQMERKQVDPEMVIRAEAMIAGFRYARGEQKITFRKPKTAERKKRELPPLGPLEQLIFDVCKLSDE